MTNIGRTANLTLTAPIVGAFGLATHAASQYQYELQDIRKEVQAQGYSGKEVNSIMKDLSTETLNWSRKFGSATTEINKGMFELVSNGYNVKQAMGMMPMLLKTMTANGDKAGQSIELTSSMLEQFGQNIGSNSKVIANGNALMNQMTEATHKSAMSLDDLKTISGNAGASMHAMGVSTNEFLAIAGRLKSAGIDASSVGTGLSAMMTRLGTGTGQAAKDLKKYNIQIFDSKGKMKDVFDILGQMQKAYKGMNDEERQKFMYDTIGQENMKVGMTLMDANLGRYKSLSNEIKNSTGTVDKYNKTMRQTNEFTQQQFMATLKALEISFGQKLLPSLTPVIKMFTNWIEAFSKLNGDQQQFIVRAGLVVAALGPILSIGGKIFSLIGNIHNGIGAIERFFIFG
ncbi:phage tail tape measure protein [Pediococcus acidilactici]